MKGIDCVLIVILWSKIIYTYIYKEEVREEKEEKEGKEREREGKDIKIVVLKSFLPRKQFLFKKTQIQSSTFTHCR